MLVAIGSVPKDGGTFTFYRNLRPAISEHGIDLRCVTVGAREAGLWDDAYADDGCVLLAPRERSIKKQSRAFVDWCVQEGVDIVIALNSVAILSALLHLPTNVRVVARCANAFDHGYRITMAGRERLERIVAITPRLKTDLVSRFGAAEHAVSLIPNGIDPVPFRACRRGADSPADRLQLGFLGRLEHNQKGVFHLPGIVRELNRREVPFELRIAGVGKHGPALERMLDQERRSGQVSFLGRLSAAEVPRFLASLDVMLFTSHFEGCPNALLEGLMAGSIPVAFLIEGITDYLIADGENGYLCEVGDYRCVAERLAELQCSPARRRSLRDAAVHSAELRFSNAHTAQAYAELFHEVMVRDPAAADALPWGRFRVNENFRRSWSAPLSRLVAPALVRLRRQPPPQAWRTR